MLNKKINEKGNYVFNLSKPENYYNQRNNEVDPYNACATTSMCLALELLGYEFPKGDYAQPEDNLITFCRTNGKVLNYYYESHYDLYKEWSVNKTSKEVYQPNEVHDVLSFATNLWIGENITYFNSNYSVDKLPYEILVRQKPVVMSGKFNGLNHVLTLVGMELNKDIDINDFNSVKFEDVVNFIVDDTYGETYNYKDRTKIGDDVYISPKQMIEDFKNHSSTTKWCHLFN